MESKEVKTATIEHFTTAICDDWDAGCLWVKRYEGYQPTLATQDLLEHLKQSEHKSGRVSRRESIKIELKGKL